MLSTFSSLTLLKSGCITAVKIELYSVTTTSAIRLVIDINFASISIGFIFLPFDKTIISFFLAVTYR